MKENGSAKCRVETLNEACSAGEGYSARVFYRLPEAVDYAEIRAKREPLRLTHYAQLTIRRLCFKFKAKAAQGKRECKPVNNYGN